MQQGIEYTEIIATDVVSESRTCTSPTPGNICIRCPVCGDEYVGFGSVREVSGHDSYRASWWGRGDLRVVAFECESGHEFELCFGSHKGNISAYCRVVKEERS